MKYEETNTYRVDVDRMLPCLPRRKSRRKEEVELCKINTVILPVNPIH